MARVLRTVAVIAGAIALTFAIPGVGAAIAGTFGATLTATGAATIAAIASGVSVAPAAPERMLSKGAGP